jgi:hypothetical protein
MQRIIPVTKPFNNEKNFNDEKEKNGWDRNKLRRKRIVQIHRQQKPLLVDIKNINEQPPFYDPCQLHLHRWKVGTIEAIENPLKKFYSKHRIPYTGRYCTVCHCPAFTYFQTKIDMAPAHLIQINMDKALHKIRLFDYNNDLKRIKNEISNKILKRWNTVITKVLCNIKIIKHPSKPIEVPLFIKNTVCQVYIDNNNDGKFGNKWAFIKDFHIDQNYVIVELFGTSIPIKVNSNYVFPNYSIYDLSGFHDTIPKFVTKNQIERWEQKWKNFQISKHFMNNLKLYISDIAQTFVTLYEDEVYIPLPHGPHKPHKKQKPVEYHKFNKSNLKSNYGEMYRNYLSKRNITREECKFFIPDNGTNRNFVYFKNIIKGGSESKVYPVVDLNLLNCDISFINKMNALSI